MIRNHLYDDREDLAKGLAASVATVLGRRIAQTGRATLAVPGGTTPARFLTLLGESALDWERVAVTLTDERWVPSSSDRSNQKLLGETLFRGPAAAATFVPLYGATAEPADAMDGIATSLRTHVLPLDICVLGMGTDGHTASLFPGADKLAAALASDAPPVLPIIAPGADEPRVTLTAPVLRAANAVALLIAGAGKWASLDAASGPGPVEDAPVRVVLNGPADIDVYYAP